MRTFTALALILAVVGSATAGKYMQHPCHKRGPRGPTNPGTPLEQLGLEDIPDNWDWGNVNGTDFLTITRQQHIPTYCGACWAFSATSALSDRIKIQRKAIWPDIVIAPQVVLSCDADNGDNGCHGGDAINAYKWMHGNNVTDETCSNYQAEGHDTGLACTPDIVCRNCAHGSKKCWVPKEYQVFGVDLFFSLNSPDKTLAQNELAIMNEIFQRGPVACGIAVPDSLETFSGDGIYCDTTGDKNLVHAISIVGYGV